MSSDEENIFGESLGDKHDESVPRLGKHEESVPRLQIEPFNPGKSSWKTYFKRLNNKFKLYNVSEEKKTLYLLDSIGEQVYERLCDLCEPNEPESKSFEEIVPILSRYFDPEPNPLAERIKFQSRIQKEGESPTDFAAELKKLTRYCKFPSDWFDEALCTQFVHGLRSQDLKFKLLDLPKLTFTNAVEYASNFVILRSSNTLDESKINSEDLINAVGKNKFKVSKEEHLELSCKHCNFTNHESSVCKFRYAKCHFCGLKGHISRACRKKLGNFPKNSRTNKQQSGKRGNLNEVEFGECDDDHPESKSYVCSDMAEIMHVKQNTSQKIMTAVDIEGKKLEFQVDTGASVTILGESKFKQHFPQKTINHTSSKLRSYSGTNIPLVGEVMVTVDGVNNLTLLVAKGNVSSIMGLEWLRALKIDITKLIHNCPVNQLKVKKLDEPNDSTLNVLLEEYEHIFQPGVGKVKGVQAQIILKPGSIPMYKRYRNVAYALVPKVEAELDRLERECIISKVTHSDFATPVVPIIKPNGSVRLCGDFKITINPQLVVEEYPIPNIESIIASIGNCEYFSKLDVTQAFNHIEVREEDRHYLTINTIKGLYQYNRLPFGITSAPAIWQRTIESILCNIKGVYVFYDDICIASETKNDHLKTLKTVFQRLKEYEVRINKEKCDFMKSSIKYCGFVISSNGLHKCPEKVDAVLKMKPPTCVTELKSFLGAVNFYGRFIPNLSNMAHPLYALLKSNAKFIFSKSCQESFKKIKEELSSERVLTLFDPKKEIVLSTDASPYGFGAILSHKMSNGNERPIAYASRTLSEAEKNWSQIEKEAAAIIYGVKKFFPYLYGNKFTLVTDHRPLLTIFGETKGLPTLSALRLQRYAIYLQAFNYEICYRRSAEHGNVDCLSRLPIASDITDEDFGEVEVFALRQINTLPVTATEISTELRRDQLASEIIYNLKNGITVNNGHILGHPQHEFSVLHDCLFWGSRVYIPENLRSRILQELHEGHMGIVKCKALARSYVWWPNIDNDIDNMIANCEPCQVIKENPAKTSFHKWQPAAAPMERVHIDYAGPMRGLYYLIVADAYSKWIDVIPVKMITSSTTIKLLQRFFSNFGTPHVLVSDNGTMFTSHEFSQFCNENGIKQKLIAPYHPASNGLAEKGVQTFKRSLKTAIYSGDSIEDGVMNFLISYRRTPHTITKQTPAELFLGRNLRSKIDLVRPLGPIRLETLANNPLPVPRSFEEGNKVAFRWYGNPRTKWKFGTVERKLGNLHYRVKCGENSFFRHIDQMRRVGNEVGNEMDPNYNDNNMQLGGQDQTIRMKSKPYNNKGQHSSFRNEVGDTEDEDVSCPTLMPPGDCTQSPDDCTQSPRHSVELSSSPQVSSQQRYEQNFERSPRLSLTQKTRSGRIVRKPNRLNL